MPDDVDQFMKELGELVGQEPVEVEHDEAGYGQAKEVVADAAAD